MKPNQSAAVAEGIVSGSAAIYHKYKHRHVRRRYPQQVKPENLRNQILHKCSGGFGRISNPVKKNTSNQRSTVMIICSGFMEVIE